MQMKLIDKKRHLDNLNLLIKQQDQTARSLALLTADEPTGYGKMSHQTIYDILKGKTEIKYWQLKEFARILHVRINKIISDDIVKCEIIQYFDRDKFHYVPRPYDQPLEVIYFLNNAYLKPTYKSFYHNAKGYYKSANFCLIDTDHAHWCHDKDKRDIFLRDTICMYQCDTDGLFYRGQILRFNKEAPLKLDRGDLVFFYNTYEIPNKSPYLLLLCRVGLCEYAQIYAKLPTTTHNCASPRK